MAIHINRLNGGNITIGSGGGSSGHAETRFTLDHQAIETHNITGTLDRQWMIDNEYWGDGDWYKNIFQADIGNTVTSIGDYVFYLCWNLDSVTIPDSVTSIGEQAFYGCDKLTSVTIGSGATSIGNGAFEECSGLTSVTFQGKTLAQVQGMDNYPWGISNTSIINVA